MNEIYSSLMEKLDSGHKYILMGILIFLPASPSSVELKAGLSPRQRQRGSRGQTELGSEEEEGGLPEFSFLASLCKPTFGRRKREGTCRAGLWRSGLLDSNL